MVSEVFSVRICYRTRKARDSQAAINDVYKRSDAVKFEPMAADLSKEDVLVGVACSHDLIAEIAPSLQLGQAIDETTLGAKDRCFHCRGCFGVYGWLVDGTASAKISNRIFK